MPSNRGSKVLKSAASEMWVKSDCCAQAAVLRIFDVKMAKMKMQLLAAWSEDGACLSGGL